MPRATAAILSPSTKLSTELAAADSISFLNLLGSTTKVATNMVAAINTMSESRPVNGFLSGVLMITCVSLYLQIIFYIKQLV